MPVVDPTVAALSACIREGVAIRMLLAAAVLLTAPACTVRVVTDSVTPPAQLQPRVVYVERPRCRVTHRVGKGWAQVEIRKCGRGYRR